MRDSEACQEFLARLSPGAWGAMKASSDETKVQQPANLSEHWPDPVLGARENCGQSIGLTAIYRPQT